MATEAVIADTAMVERRRSPAAGFVTIFADIVRGNVVRGFSGRLGAIMATVAVGADPAVVECRRRPARDLMAILAHIACR